MQYHGLGGNEGAQGTYALRVSNIQSQRSCPGDLRSLPVRDRYIGTALCEPLCHSPCGEACA
jgi:hypothetical protein